MRERTLFEQFYYPCYYCSSYHLYFLIRKQISNAIRKQFSGSTPESADDILMAFDTGGNLVNNFFYNSRIFYE